jgi:tRNA(Ile)-lysidine synthase
MAMRSEVIDAIRETGLAEPGARVLAMLSGGADSVCLLHSLSELLGRESVVALHVNHGLRAAAAADQRFCAGLCERLGVALFVERAPVPGGGNTEALARESRYRLAEEVRARAGLDWIATGHTASDNAETVLYRLVSSPGRRALLGIRPRRGRLIRPLLGITRDQARAYCEQAGLGWREDETNLDRSIARNRLRLDVLPQLRKVHPAVDRNLLATAAELADESELLERGVDRALAELGAGGHPPTVEAAALAKLEAPLRRLVLRRLAEQAAGGPLPLSGERMRELERLASGGGSAYADLGAGVRAACEYGLIRFRRAGAPEAVAPVELPVPGSCRFGEWELSCELQERPREGEPLGSVDEPVLDAARIERPLTVRAWAEGDRMRPLGLTGTKSLQDLFTDRKVPRSLRHALPVVVSGEEIAWVAGVAVSDAFKLTARTTGALRLRARAGGAHTRI